MRITDYIDKLKTYYFCEIKKVHGNNKFPEQLWYDQGMQKLDLFCESIYEIVEDKKVLNNISQTYFELIASH